MDHYSKPIPELKGHPLVTPGGPSVGIISIENPVVPPQIDEAEFTEDLDLAGLTHQKTTSDYGGPEECYLIYGASRDQISNWAQQLGQKYAIFSIDGRPELICVTGPESGTYCRAHPEYGFSKDRPQGYHTELPGLGFIRLYFDPALAPTPTLLRKHSHHHHPAGGGTIGGATTPPGMLQVPDGTAWLMGGLRPALSGLGAVTHAVTGAPHEKPEERTPSRHSHEWHNGSTEHHLPIKGQGVTVPATHMRNRVIKSDVNTPAVDFRYLCQPFGALDPRNPSDLNFYSVGGRQPAIDRLLAHHGYTHVPMAGGKVDYRTHNYNTRALVVPFAGNDEVDSWRVLHELGHGLTHQPINKEFGEGRRVGQVDIDLTLREALRAVAWEYATMARQRGLLADVGVTISDDDFNRDLNTVMADSVCRVITGAPVDLAAAGFRPYSYGASLSTALNLVREAALAVGVTDDTLVKSAAPQRSMGQYMLNHFSAKGPAPEPGIMTYVPHPSGGFKINYRNGKGDFSHDATTGQSGGSIQPFTNSPRRDVVHHHEMATQYPAIHAHMASAARHIAQAHRTLNEFNE